MSPEMLPGGGEREDSEDYRGEKKLLGVMDIFITLTQWGIHNTVTYAAHFQYMKLTVQRL